jgi:hypothetical protein
MFPGSELQQQQTIECYMFSGSESQQQHSSLPSPTHSRRNAWNPGGIQVAGRNWSESGWIPTSFRVKI